MLRIAPRLPHSNKMIVMKAIMLLNMRINFFENNQRVEMKKLLKKAVKKTAFRSDATKVASIVTVLVVTKQPMITC